MRFIFAVFAAFLLVSCSDSPSHDADSHYKTWKHYLGDPGRSHFSTLDAFSLENVNKLQVAWEYEAPDSGQMQMNPLIVDSLLFGVSAALRVFALDAKTGKQVWIFGDSLKAWHSTSRGVSYWESGKDRRIFYTHGSDLWALEASTGTPVASFGQGGKIDLRSGLRAADKDKFVISATPGTVFKNSIIMPLRLSEGEGAARGDLVAFDTQSGKVIWSFNTIPLPGDMGSDTWGNNDVANSPVVGGGNSWAGTTLDEGREILFVPTGSAAPDFYGGMRLGKNLFTNSLLALDANTGKYLWHFQFTHHDLWDRDLPAPPNLLTVTRNGKLIDAVAQVTKQGYVFLFERETGLPLFEIEERPVPGSEIVGEQAWPTQPFPVTPAPFARQIDDLTAADISPYAPNRDSLITIFNQTKKAAYYPPSLEPVLLLPGYDGGAEWGGAGADPEKGILYVNANEMAWFLQLKPTESNNVNLSLGEVTYDRYCSVCHQGDRKGLPKSGYPSLINLSERFNTKEILNQILQGKGMMPGFPHLTETEQKELLDFLLASEEKKEASEAHLAALESQVPYQHTGYNKFLDQNGLPAISPPWGTLQAIDLNTGDYLWKVPLGETESLNLLGYPTTGTENYGGPVITKNGLLFIAGTKDGYIRAFNRFTGELLWEYKLPAAAFATPALYEIQGKQFLVIACGGEKLGTKKGNRILAFSLN